MEDWLRKTLEFFGLENSQLVNKILRELGLEDSSSRSRAQSTRRTQSTSRNQSVTWTQSTPRTNTQNPPYTSRSNTNTRNPNTNNRTTIEEDLVFDPLSGEFKSRSEIEASQKSSVGSKHTNSNTASQASSNSSNNNICYDGEINEHGYVDLGLPSGLKWATTNVGALWPGEFGYYFSWGDTNPKSNYIRENCPTHDKNNVWLSSNGYINKDGNLILAHDPARANWGGSWRLPTLKELEELVRYTTTKWTTIGGVNGRLVISKINGKSIFLPASGWRDGTTPYSQGVRGYCWGSTPNTQNLWRAAYICFSSDGFEVNWSDRKLGRSVRPVSN